jgi:hypothetical protein
VAISTDGATWEQKNMVTATASDWTGIAYGDGKWMAVHYSGIVAGCGKDGTIIVNGTTHSVAGRKEIYVEPSDITDNQVTLSSANNIRLISAEITNSPYGSSCTKKVKGFLKDNAVLLDGQYSFTMDIQNCTWQLLQALIPTETGRTVNSNEITSVNGTQSRALSYSTINIGTIEAGGSISISASGTQSYALNYSTITILRCDGDLTVTGNNYGSTITKWVNPRYTYENASGVEIEQSLAAVETVSISVSPDTHKYEPQPDGTYKVQFGFYDTIPSNVVIDVPTICFSPLRLPDSAVTRVIDFSQSVGNAPLRSESSIFLYKPDALAWDSNLGYWKVAEANNQAFQIDTYPGDSFMCIESLENPVQLQFIDSDGSGGDAFHQYDFTGFHRRFLDIASQRPGWIINLDCMNYPQGLWKYHFVGTTRPINAVLYCGASGSTLHSKEWQSNSEGTVLSDATTAARKVTTDACAKLKADYGDDIRIYVIKFRKQEAYKHKVAGTEVNFDYNYIDACATATAHLYDVAEDYYKKGAESADTTTATAEANLAKALSDISADIKSWAGFEDAKNVE